MENRYFLLSIALLASGTALAMKKGDEPPSKKPAYTQEKPFKCSYPGCVFATLHSNNLLIHIKTHTGERRYKRDYPGCDYAAVQSDNLTRHKLAHTGKKQFALNYPSHNFVTAQSNSLDHHKILTHAGQGPKLTSPICTPSNNCKTSLPTCKRCNSICTSSTFLLKHELRHQNTDRLFQLQQHNTHVQDAFTIDTLLKYDRS